MFTRALRWGGGGRGSPNAGGITGSARLGFKPSLVFSLLPRGSQLLVGSKKKKLWSRVGERGGGLEDAWLRSRCRGASVPVWALVYSFQEPIKKVSSFALVDGEEASGRGPVPRALTAESCAAFREAGRTPGKGFREHSGKRPGSPAGVNV